jgi:uncharacterized membrane protein (UPF0127 family)
MQRENFDQLILLLISAFVGVFLIGAIVAAILILPKFNLSREDTAKMVTLDLDQVEIADTPATRDQGLMYRDTLCPTCGMLFVFPEEKPLSFWMHNTNVPLDIIFMNREGIINAIHRHTIPNQDAPTYPSKAPSTYVLEVNAGSFPASIHEGDKVNISKLLEKKVPYSQPVRQNATV